jgi:hypothetical protein
MSVSEFARRYGYKEGTVLKVISRYWGTDRTPRGSITARILGDLQSAIATTEEKEHEAVSFS